MTTLSTKSKRAYLERLERLLENAGLPQHDVNRSVGRVNEELYTTQRARALGADQPEFVGGGPKLEGQRPGRAPRRRRGGLPPKPSHTVRPDETETRVSRLVGGKAPQIERKANLVHRMDKNEVIEIARRHRDAAIAKTSNLPEGAPQKIVYSFAPRPEFQRLMATELLRSPSPIVEVTFGDRVWRIQDLAP